MLIGLLDETSGFMNINGVMCRAVDLDIEYVPPEELIRVPAGDKIYYFVKLPPLRELWEFYQKNKEGLNNE